MNDSDLYKLLYNTNKRKIVDYTGALGGYVTMKNDYEYLPYTRELKKYVEHQKKTITVNLLSSGNNNCPTDKKSDGNMSSDIPFADLLFIITPSYVCYLLTDNEAIRIFFGSELQSHIDLRQLELGKFLGFENFADLNQPAKIKFENIIIEFDKDIVTFKKASVEKESIGILTYAQFIKEIKFRICKCEGNCSGIFRSVSPSQPHSLTAANGGKTRRRYKNISKNSHKKTFGFRRRKQNNRFIINKRRSRRY